MFKGQIIAQKGRMGLQLFRYI